jgi:hypothetical protein
MSDRENLNTWRKPSPVPFCPLQSAHNLTWPQSQAVTVGSWWLTAHTTARPNCYAVNILSDIETGFGLRRKHGSYPSHNSNRVHWKCSLEHYYHKICSPAIKCIMTVTAFRLCEGRVVWCDSGRTIHKKFVQKWLMKRIWLVRQDFHENKNWILFHDNGPIYTTSTVRRIILQNGIAKISPPPSPTQFTRLGSGY